MRITLMPLVHQHPHPRISSYKNINVCLLLNVIKINMELHLGPAHIHQDNLYRVVYYDVIVPTLPMYTIYACIVATFSICVEMIATAGWVNVVLVATRSWHICLFYNHYY